MTGRNRATIYRDIKNGKLSANRTEKGGWEIDPTELNRVYPHPVAGNRADNASNNKSRIDETAVSRETFEQMQRQLQDSQETIRDLRQRLDREADERREAQAKLTAMLTGPPKPWWRRVLGG